MPKVSCPQCNKAYDVPEQALGRMATCKCGKKFRLGQESPAKTRSPSVPQVTQPAEPGEVPHVVPKAPASTRRKLSRRGGSERWQRKVDIAVRVLALVIPFVVSGLAYVWLAATMDPETLGGPILYSIAIFFPFFAFGVVIAKRGVSFGPGATVQRVIGLKLLAFAVVTAAIGLVLLAVVPLSISWVFYISSSLVLTGIVLLLFGLAQVVTGRAPMPEAA